MMQRASRRTIVIGIGNPDRCDDGAGRSVAQSLRGRMPAHVEIAELDGEATSLLALLEGADAAVLIDACLSDSAPGTVQRFDVRHAPLPNARFNLSTHGLGLADAVELARSLGQLPASCVVYAIEAGSVGQGRTLSAPVAAAVDIVSARVQADISLVESAGHA